MGIYEALIVIVDFLNKQPSQGDMASVKINNEGSCYLSIGITDARPRMSLEEFAFMVDD